MLVKEIMQSYTNFLISLIFISLLLILFRVSLPATYYLTPLLVLPMLILATAIGLTIAVINVVLMDIEKIINYLLGLLMFLTPVVYTADHKTGIVKIILTWNPMSYLHGCARDLIVFGHSQTPVLFMMLTLAAFLLLLLSMKWFYLAEEKVIEKMI